MCFDAPEHHHEVRRYRFARVALLVIQKQVADDVHVVTRLVVAVQGGADVEDRPELRFAFSHGQPVRVRVVDGFGNDGHACHGVALSC